MKFGLDEEVIDKIKNIDLKNHIKRVGKIFYKGKE